jgi:2,5-diketo-D-gluconate reductase A
MTVPSIVLNNGVLDNGVTIPQFGFGTWQVPPADAKARVLEAFEAGYRHVDTAQMYGNEEGVGAAVADSGLAREEVFVTTKLNNNRHEPASAVASLDESLRRLRLEQVDLFLIHWPLPTTDLDYTATWAAMVTMLESGKARAVGVSNFQADHLQKIIDATGVVPAANQIEVHPYLRQDALRATNTRLGIATEAWSPLAQGAVFDDPALAARAREVGRPVSQVVLRWHIQRGDIVFPKASTPERITENIDVFDFTLTDAQVAAIDALDAGRRYGPDPDTFAWIP